MAVEHWSGGLLIGAIGEDSYAGIMEGIPSQGIGRGVWIFERRMKWARLIAVEERLVAFGLFTLFFIAISVLVELACQHRTGRGARVALSPSLQSTYIAGEGLCV